MVSLGVEESVVALKRRCLELLNENRSKMLRPPLDSLPTLRMKEGGFELCDNDLAADVVDQEVLECKWSSITLPEVCWKLVVSFGGATDVLALRRVSNTLRKLALEEMVWSLLLPTSEPAFVVWNAAETGPAEAKKIQMDLADDDDLAWAFSVDGKMLVAFGKASYPARVWRTGWCEPVANLASSVHEVTWSPNGKLLACAPYADSTVRLYDTATWEPVETVFRRPDERAPCCIAFSPNSKMLASSCDDGDEGGSVVVWNVATGTELWSLEGHGDLIKFSPDSKRLYHYGLDHVVRVSSCETGRKLFDVQCPGPVSEFTQNFALGGNYFATSCNDLVNLWDARTGSLCRDLSDTFGHVDDVDCFAFSPDSRLLVIIGPTASATFVDTTTSSIIGSLRAPDSHSFRNCFFTASSFRRH